MADLLLELFSEEIPARMQERGAEDLRRLMAAGLAEAGLTAETAEAHGGPRRLVLWMTGLPAVQPDRREERKGPRVGAPEKAVQGFLRAAGLDSLDACEIREDKKGGYYVAVTEMKGRPTADVIAAIVPAVVRDFPWPKSQRWGAGRLRWVRPLHSILCVFDGAVVSFEVEGVSSGGETRGHRVHGPEAISVRTFAEYEHALAEARVVVRAGERRTRILEGARALCAAEGLELVEDRGLLDEVAGLVEWPVPLLGAMDPKFLDLPGEVLTSAMRTHQKYFAVRDPKTGALAPRFVVVANLEADDGGAAIRAGNERVLTARLSDARFLWDQDRKATLEDRLPALDKITFFEGLGSVGDKARRVAALARELAPVVGAEPDLAERAGLLAKADLVTEMVGEFPELQGVMGRYYALEAGEPAEVADALRDHYKPAGQDDEVPTAPVSVAVGLADKIDTLTAFWAIGRRPTGSKDPFALRRAALGVLRISLGLKGDIHFRPVLERHLEGELLGLAGPPAEDAYLANNAEIVDDLEIFLQERLRVLLREQGGRHDIIDAAFETLRSDVTLKQTAGRVEALQAFLETEDGANLLAAYKRAGNILKAEEKKDGARYDGAAEADLLAEPAEQALHAALADAAGVARAAAVHEDFAAAMGALARLRAPLDRFFDEVTVVAEDDKVRRNRLMLLSEVRAACGAIADFSQIQG